MDKIQINELDPSVPSKVISNWHNEQFSEEF